MRTFRTGLIRTNPVSFWSMPARLDSSTVNLVRQELLVLVDVLIVTATVDADGTMETDYHDPFQVEAY